LIALHGTFLLKIKKLRLRGGLTMLKPKAHGTFIKRGSYLFRTSAYLQWGESEKSIGSCLLLNPGSANFDKMDTHLTVSLATSGKADGEINTDPTMDQLIQVVKGIYGSESSLDGRFHIYNLFNLQNTKSVHAIDQFESLIESGEYDIEESLVPIDQLRLHPWILIGWGVEHKSNWSSLGNIKKLWRHLINESGISSFGKNHNERDDYYHPCPLIPTRRPAMVKELIDQYHQKLKKPIVRFPAHATQPNMIVESGFCEQFEESERGWFKSPTDPEIIVKGFSHLRIMDGYKLRAYQYSDGANGNGVVWAIPSHADLPDPVECENLDDHFLSAPKPSQALEDFMQAIEGDKTPLSYLQASVVFHELHEFGAMWHGVSWGRDVILPMSDDQKTYFDNLEWEMSEEEPDIIEPHFYYSYEGNPIVVFHTINDIGTVTLNRYVHTFNKDDYTMQVELTCIATAGGGIIF
jgi:hypothetical protein